MKTTIPCALAALALTLAVPARAQDRPTVAIMPTQYFSADAGSAERVTRALAEQYERQGYRVMPMDRAQSAFESLGLQPSRHYADRTALSFGRKMGADLVAYPRLLAMGIPAAANPDSPLTPEAVLHLRVLNVHSRNPIYCRQIGHPLGSDLASAAEEFRLPAGEATMAANKVTSNYFGRVAGSRQEFRRRK